MATTVRDNREAGRFEVLVDGEVAAFTEYTLSDGVMTMPHTVTERAFRGQGLAEKVVRSALESARDAGLTVRPVCPYVKKFIQENPEFQGLVAAV